MDAKEYFDNKIAQPETGLVIWKRKMNGSCSATKGLENMFMTQLRRSVASLLKMMLFSFGPYPSILISDALCSFQSEQCQFFVLQCQTLAVLGGFFR